MGADMEWDGVHLRLYRINAGHSDFREGCPLTTTALEVAVDSEVIGKATRTAFAAWEREIAQALKDFGISAKEAVSRATAILSQLEGALLLARIYRNPDPMRRAEEFCVCWSDKDLRLRLCDRAPETLQYRLATELGWG
jgi:Transcriptional regulator LmrA/YxaF-like, C-terminal domain